MKVICLTGGLASGKSTAARFLADHGAKVIDADKLGHRAYDPSTQAYREVIAAFGDDVVGEDGQIDRKVLGSKVFGKPEELKRLTDIVWPEIRRMAEAEIREAETASADSIVVLEAAVLFEAGWDDIGDEIWVATVDREVAIERAMARDGLPREAVESRLDSQLSNSERTARADVVLDNSGTPEQLDAQLVVAWERAVES
ncbi:MAG: dephospho-CoA kinase [Pseudomonadales bacterium]|nr:dephospho-CoA kinase [Pseudomonadales bacterium]